MKKYTFLLLPLLALSCNSFDPIAKLDQYNVVWDSPSVDHTGSMPLGNGDLSVNAWMDNDGELSFYIGKTDAWSDNARLLKVGKVSVSLSPKPDLSNFRQTLDLKTGSILFEFGPEEAEVKLRLWADALHPVIRLEAEAEQALQLTAHADLWRTKSDTLPSFEVSDVLLDRSQPDQKHDEMVVTPDHLIENLPDAIGWYHHNARSVGPELTLRIQGLSDYPMKDPLLYRTFGTLIKGSQGKRIDDQTLQTGTSTKPSINLYVLTKHPTTPEQWQKDIVKIEKEYESISAQAHAEAHQDWWDQFWNRSWIFAEGDDEAEIINRGYVLQRFITACAGRGNFPIKFNGSIYTVPFEGAPGDADYRRWGPGYWWQNTRLPYLSMCTSGDFEMLKPLFRMYAGEVFELSKYRVQRYFGFDGVYFPECINFWGTVFSESYGWQPMEEREDPLQTSGYHKWEWVSGPELAWMMLDYFDHTQDQAFLQDTILPVAFEVMKFFDNYYPTNDSGKLVMYPSQAVETWWDCTNPMPELSGLIALSERINNLSEKLLENVDTDWLRSFMKKLPDLPLRELENGQLALAPAERYEQKRNIENPELYAVFPFRLVAFEKPTVDWGLNAFNSRWDKGNFGWRQEEIFQAYLGLTAGCKENLAGRAASSDQNSRFPAFWGPNYDWVPDQDHGGVLMKAFQAMLIQTEEDHIFLTPAWPKEWSGEFKVHAPFNTTIQGTIENGEIVQYKVAPRSREKDITVY